MPPGWDFGFASEAISLDSTGFWSLETPEGEAGGIPTAGCSPNILSEVITKNNSLEI